MALTEENEIVQVAADRFGYIGVRMDTVIRRDGAEISRSTQRALFVPGDDLSAQPDRVRAIALATWTPEVVNAHVARTEEAKAEQDAETKTREDAVTKMEHQAEARERKAARNRAVPSKKARQKRV